MARHPVRPSGRRTLLLIVAIGLAPIIASYAAYYWFTPSKRVNYGELLETAPAPIVAGRDADGKAFSLTELRGKWVLLIASRGELRRRLRARSLRYTPGAHDSGTGTGSRGPSAAAAADGADARARSSRPHIPGSSSPGSISAALEQLPLGTSAVDGVLLLDPRGNLVLRYGPDPDIRGLAKDLQRLLKASQIG